MSVRETVGSWRIALSWIVIIALCGYLGLILMLSSFQTKLLFPASRDVWRNPGDAPFHWAYDEVSLRVGDETTCGWFIPVDNARGTILFSHGNGGCVAERLDYVRIFRPLGVNVLLYDYGGYGKSTGKPSEKRCYADVRAMWRYLTVERRIPQNKIILMGESLGGGVTVDLAAEVQPAGVILQSTFLSVTRRAKEIFPILPVGLFLKHRFDNAAKIGQVRSPLLIIHSPDDTVIPFHHGKDLFALAPNPKTFLEIRGDHNSGPFESVNTYVPGIGDFLGTVLKP